MTRALFGLAAAASLGSAYAGWPAAVVAVAALGALVALDRSCAGRLSAAEAALASLREEQADTLKRTMTLEGKLRSMGA